MNPLAYVLRQLGDIVGIKHTRADDELRAVAHGGPLSDLAARQVVHTQATAAQVRQRATEL